MHEDSAEYDVNTTFVNFNKLAILKLPILWTSQNVCPVYELACTVAHFTNWVVLQTDCVLW
jgi:hypothetical protein